MICKWSNFVQNPAPSSAALEDVNPAKSGIDWISKIEIWQSLTVHENLQSNPLMLSERERRSSSVRTIFPCIHANISSPFNYHDCMMLDYRFSMSAHHLK